MTPAEFDAEVAALERRSRVRHQRCHTILRIMLRLHPGLPQNADRELWRANMVRVVTLVRKIEEQQRRDRLRATELGLTTESTTIH